MAVSKRLRYEVLRRDNHTCRYCGAQAPDVKLTVDNMAPYAGDAFQYPLQFLLLPHVVLQLTNDFLAVRTVW